MPRPRPFRFGVQASSATNRSAWVELARRVEEQGYSTLTMPDHLGEQLAPVPALMAAADATTTLRVGGLVLDNDFKHPVVLAKELATLDVLSDGRLEIGIGAGWMRADYDGTGIPYDPPGVRIDRMVEAIRLIKALLAPGPAALHGDHYQVTDLEGFPKPVQQPHPPFLIGGGGRRMLGVAAREADIVGINGTLTAGAIGPEVLGSMRAAAVDERIPWIRAAAGDRFEGIELNVRAFFVSVTNDREGVASNLAAALGFDVEEILSTPFALIGSPQQLVDDLCERRDRWGFSYVIVGAEDTDAFAPVVAELTGH
ncbi:MAG TPA: LLM class F420-dependent oxidoreductase [Acidimicrobiales bacterium]|jgi:probable F420-dependent oxidoreductase